MNIDTHALLLEMSTLYSKIQDGTAQIGDLEAFAAAAAHVNERAIILRYKAYEEKVFGVRRPEAEIPQAAETEQVAEEVVTTEAAIESNDPDMSIPVPADPAPIAHTEPEGFDLFSMNEEEEDEPVFTPFATEEATQKEDEIVAPDDMPDFDEPEKADAVEPEVKVQTEIVTHENAEKPEISNPAPVIQHPVVEAEPTAPSEPKDAPVFANVAPQPELPANEMKPSTLPSGNLHPLYNRISSGDDSLASRLLSVKLETLNGSFGFNEKMQMVQELFQGNSEQFNTALSQLDNLSSKNEARALVTQYANQYNWSDRSDLVMEFVKKVERRYA